MRDLNDKERANFAALPFDPEELQRDTGVGALPGEEGWSPLERIGGRPAADVNGVWGGYTGFGSKTVIPAEAHAKVSFLGVVLPSDRIHAPNQRLLLANYHRGVRAAAYTFAELARPEVVAALRAWRR